MRPPDTLFDLAFHNLRRKKVRTLLTIIGIAVCSNLFITITSIANFLERDIDHQVRSFSGQIIIQARGEFSTAGVEWPPLNSSLSESEVAEVIARPEVNKDCSTAALFVSLAPPSYPGAPPEVLAVGIQPKKEAAVLHEARLLKGRNTLSLSNQGPPEVIIGVVAGRALARTASSTVRIPTRAGDFTVPDVGSTITVRGQTMKVVGLLHPEGNQLFRSLMVMPLATAQQLFERQGTVSAAIITPGEASGIAQLAASLEAEHPSFAAVTDEKLKATASLEVDQQKRFMDVIRGTAIVAAAVIVTIVMFVAVLERTREIGTMRAIGAPSRAVMLLIINESLFLMLVGTIAGIPISVVALNNSIRDGRYLNDQWVWLVSTALLVTVGLLASLAPAWHAAKVDPAVAIRYE